MEKKEKIYIAGHQGLVGSAILQTLRQQGYDNIITRTKQMLDLRSLQSVEYFFDSERPDYVFLAAAKVGGIVANNTYRAEFIYDNLQIQNNVIHCAYRYGVKKLLFLGSTCIYPKNAPQPIKESYLLTGELEYTNEPYAIAKIAGIKMCESYNIQYGTNFLCVMPTNLYGPNDNFDLETSHVLPALIRKIHLAKALYDKDYETIKADLNQRPLKGISGSASIDTIQKVLSTYGIGRQNDGVSVEIWGSGKPMREFLWSEDLAQACVHIMCHVSFQDLTQLSHTLNNTCTPWTHTTKSIRNTHINVGTGKEISIKDLALLIKKIIGFQGEFVFNTEKPDGMMRKRTDVSKIHALGWKHRVELDEGIEKLYQWYLNTQDQCVAK